MVEYQINLQELIAEKSAVECREREIPLTEVAVETGLSYLTILKLKQDGSCWSRKTLDRLCFYFGKEPGEILKSSSN